MIFRREKKKEFPELSVEIETLKVRDRPVPVVKISGTVPPGSDGNDVMARCFADISDRVLRARIGELQNELREKSEPFCLAVRYPSAKPTTSSGKIALFRELFRGRRDVFPTRWVNAKKGTSGYMRS